jgi:hypothetical protein
LASTSIAAPGGSSDGIELGDRKSPWLGAVDDPSDPDSELVGAALIGTDESTSAIAIGAKVVSTGVIGWFDGEVDGIELREGFNVGTSEGMLLVLGLDVGSVNSTRKRKINKLHIICIC